MAVNEFPSKRAPFYKDVPDDQWNDWRWQLSHRLNALEDFEPILRINSQRAQGAFKRAPFSRGDHALFRIPDRSG